MAILVTGGAGFSGSNFVLDWLAQSDEPLIKLDERTCAGKLESLAGRQGDARHVFVQGARGARGLPEPAKAAFCPLRVSTEGYGSSHKTQITPATDRPAHGRRHAIDAREIERELGGRPAETFEIGTHKAVQRYLGHRDRVQRVQSGANRERVCQHHGEEVAA
jgi:dTDP-D-glucose 4,6-dehydratase